MENQSTPNGTKAPNKNTGLIVALAIFIIAAIGLGIWLFSVQGNMKALKAEKEAQKTELMNQLNSLMKQHDQLKVEYGSLSDSLATKDSVIQANATEIKKLMATRWEYFKVRKKLHNLQLIEQGFVRQMDSLYRVNKALKVENNMIKEQVQTEKAKNVKLSQEKQELAGKVETASIIPVYNLTAEGVHVTGTGRERKTDKVKRINKIKVCFTAGANKITQPGVKDFYVRIAQPDKKILTIDNGDEYSFEFQGNKLQYSIMKEVDYQNQSVDICVYWSKSQAKELPKGLYHVDIYANNHNIATTSFTLK
ncbi:MAG: hypothetical protein JXR71_08545 [Bacteroidales bacterium]|nr:hypothetical protein [Bacteroidales bacterium]